MVLDDSRVRSGTLGQRERLLAADALRLGVAHLQGRRALGGVAVRGGDGGRDGGGAGRGGGRCKAPVSGVEYWMWGRRWQSRTISLLSLSTKRALAGPPVIASDADLDSPRPRFQCPSIEACVSSWLVELEKGVPVTSQRCLSIQGKTNGGGIRE